MIDSLVLKLTLFLELNDRSWWWIRTFFVDHSVPLAIPSSTGTALESKTIIVVKTKRIF